MTPLGLPSEEEGEGFQPHWDEMLSRLDEAEASFGPYRADDGFMSFAAPSSQMVSTLIEEFRHVIRYARDAESGNAELRRLLEREKKYEGLTRFGELGDDV